MNCRILSYPINERTQVYVGNPKLEITQHKQVCNGNSSNSFVIKLHNHSGTHIDAPRHFFNDGLCISDYGTVICFKAGVVDCEKSKDELIEPSDLWKSIGIIEKVECLLIRTGSWKFRKEERYVSCGVGVSPESIEWIRKNYQNIKCLGLDTLSISAFKHREKGRKAHAMAFCGRNDFGEPLLVIEDMNLCDVNGIFDIMIVPWQIEGLDSAPCTVIAK